MGLFIRGKTACELCGKPLRHRDAVVSFPAFLPGSHPLSRFSDATFHRSCFEAAPEHNEVERLHARHRQVWDARPRDLKTVAEMDAWARNAFQTVDRITHYARRALAAEMRNAMKKRRLP